MQHSNKKSVLPTRWEEKEMNTKYIGLDTHKKTIAVSIADIKNSDVRYYGCIDNTKEAVDKLAKKLQEKTGNPSQLYFCYEAGPCGYEIYRQLKQLGCNCQIIAPSLIPKKPGARVKTDRRDSETLARLHRAGELTATWVPDREQEAMRDLTRAREDMKHLQLQSQQYLSAFLLRHGKTYGGKSRWGKAYFHWLETLTFDSPVQQVVFQEYVDMVKQHISQVKSLEQEMERALPNWSLAPVVEGLMALRGCQLITAVTLLAELGDLTRFDKPSQLMAYLGLVPSEHSSGGKTRRGGITKTGNSHARRILIEAAWNYRFQARKSRCIEKRAQKTPPQIQRIAWEGQKRLCGRYRYLLQQGKHKCVAATAVARELAGFVWAIAWEYKHPREDRLENIQQDVKIKKEMLIDKKIWGKDSFLSHNTDALKNRKSSVKMEL